MPVSQDHLDAIIAAVIAVNGYGLKKSYALLPVFRKAGLTNPANVAREDVVDVMMNMFRSGYDRGLLTEMMAGRLVDLMKAVSMGKLDGVSDLVAKGDRDAAIDLLCEIKGIGPKVAADVWMLVNS